MRLSDNARTAMINALVDLTDGGSGAGTVQIRDGTAPAGPSEAATGTLLVTLTFNDPAFGAGAAGVADVDVDPSVSAFAVASGTPTWYRVLDSDSTAIWDGDVSADMTVEPASIVNGGVVTLTSWSVTQPAS